MQAVHALVPAAGEGRRFARSGRTAAAGGKLFAQVGAWPLLEWTLDRLLDEPDIASVTVALAASRLADFQTTHATARRATRRAVFVVGGGDRQASVERCLAASPAAADDLILVHDGGRPCLSGEDLVRVIAAAREHGAAVLGRPVTDTVKRVVGGRLAETVDRRQLFRAETPQVLPRRELERGLAAARERGERATDESGLLERLGLEVRAVEARRPNPKLTTSADLPLIQALLLAGVPPRCEAAR
ncbi:MAG TPA: 2-C-methyl-D-erythritol 4-phosphate cytidylyltransferase [Thermoanaerobaculia bacterium]|nr:2-C-methyl-D-erythritol 4-phosphate cytidylyltransferase [Thermoanaerobaculia bacterium]